MMLWHLAAIAVVAGALGTAGGWKARGWIADRQAAETTAGIAAEREAAMLSALTETARRLAAQKGITDAAKTRTAAALAERDAAASAADSLRQRAEQLAAECSAAGAAVADGGPPASAAGVVLADMLQRLEARGRDAAAAADAAFSAGVACEAAYESVTVR
jgi:hypothetical protein